MQTITTLITEEYFFMEESAFTDRSIPTDKLIITEESILGFDNRLPLPVKATR